MSKPNDPKPEERQGDIELKLIKNNQFDGLYKPRKKMAEAAGLKLGISAKMVHVNLSKQTLTIYPLVTWPDHTDFLKSKYKKIERICFSIEESLCDFFRKNLLSKPTICSCSFEMFYCQDSLKTRTMV